MGGFVREVRWHDQRNEAQVSYSLPSYPATHPTLHLCVPAVGKTPYVGMDTPQETCFLDLPPMHQAVGGRGILFPITSGSHQQLASGGSCIGEQKRWAPHHQQKTHLVVEQNLSEETVTLLNKWSGGGQGELSIPLPYWKKLLPDILVFAGEVPSDQETIFRLLVEGSGQPLFPQLVPTQNQELSDLLLAPR